MHKYNDFFSQITNSTLFFRGYCSYKIAAIEQQFHSLRAITLVIYIGPHCAVIIKFYTLHNFIAFLQL